MTRAFRSRAGTLWVWNASTPERSARRPIAKYAVSLHEVCTEGAAVLSWRLYLPESWANYPERLAEAGVPEEVKFRKKWELALEMIDQARGWKLTDRIVVAEARYGDGTALREELEKRKFPYAVVG